MGPAQARHGLMERYRSFLPIDERTPIISMNEGSTPLVRSRQLEDTLGLGSLHFKYEGLNPTGSFKDRGMVMAVARALENESRVIVCASTGNTSASAAAYAARFGLRAIVIIPEGTIAMGKLLQALVHGARVVSIRGNFDRALEVVRELARDFPVTLVNSVNPDRIAGQRTAAFEIIDELGGVPDFVALPVGNAGNITAYWQGFVQYHREGLSDALPAMLGAQAEGAAPIVRNQVVEHPETVASAIRIGNPASWEFATEALAQSGGLIDMVSDQEILAAQSLLASREGLFCEPASAASLAVLVKLRRAGTLPAGISVVCVLTGHGLKDPETPLAGFEAPLPVDADARQIARLLKL
ncbi:MAG: threonine synthase [Candidatus Dormibacteria bacterium]